MTTQLETLSERELEIARLLVFDLSDKQIAGLLCIAGDTVGNYVSQAIAKLGVRSRTGVAIWYVRVYGFPVKDVTFSE